MKYKTIGMLAVYAGDLESKFKCIEGNIITTGMSVFIKNGCLSWEDGKVFLITKDTFEFEWELVQEPVSFMEAVKAYAEKKTIKCISKYGEREYHYCCTNTGMVDNIGSAMSPEEILHGKWYIED